MCTIKLYNALFLSSLLGVNPQVGPPTHFEQHCMNPRDTSEKIIQNQLTNWILRNPEVHYRSYISQQLVPILIKVRPVPSITIYLLHMYFIIILILSASRLPYRFFPSSLFVKTFYAFLDSSYLLHALSNSVVSI